jgi:hypothetical protein
MLTLSGLLRLPSFGLLLSLAALILLEPLAGHLSGAVPLLATLHLSVLWLAVRLVSSTRDELTVTRLLAAPTILLNLGSLIVEQPALAMADLAMRTVFYAHVIRCLLAYVLRDAVGNGGRAVRCDVCLRIARDAVRVRVRAAGDAGGGVVLGSRRVGLRPGHPLGPALFQLHGPHQHGLRRHPSTGASSAVGRGHRAGDGRDVRSDPDRTTHRDDPDSQTARGRLTTVKARRWRTRCARVCAVAGSASPSRSRTSRACANGSSPRAWAIALRYGSESNLTSSIRCRFTRTAAASNARSACSR